MIPAATITPRRRRTPKPPSIPLRGFFVLLVVLACTLSSPAAEKPAGQPGKSGAPEELAMSPEELVTRYFDRVRAGDSRAVAELMHEEELASLRDSLLPLFTAVSAADSEPPPIFDHFYQGDDVETIRKDSPERFFARVMEFFMAVQPEAVDALREATVTPLGHVLEGDMAHVVYRLYADTPRARIDRLVIMSASREGAGWRLMLPSEIENLALTLRRPLEQKMGPSGDPQVPPAPRPTPGP